MKQLILSSRGFFTKLTIMYFICLFLGLTKLVYADSPIVALKTPNGGLQPHSLIDSKGNIHLIYFQGDQNSGNLFYVTKSADKEEFSKAIHVNSVNGSVMGGVIRSGQLALGKGDRVHVVWNGAKNVKNNMEYTQLNDSGTGFEPEKGLMQVSMSLDAVGAVAADKDGNVHVIWHAYKLSEKMNMDESTRLVWISSSKDDGKTFAKETPVWDSPTGVCGCCAMNAIADSKGNINIMYRSNSGGNRDIYSLYGKESGKSFVGGVLQGWKVSMCPASSIGFAKSLDFVISTWETQGQIYFATIKDGMVTTKPLGLPQATIGAVNFRKYSCVAINNKGEIIIAWWEGKGKGFYKQPGGDIVWQVFDNNGNPTNDRGRVASEGTPSVVATEKSFVVFH